jgi:23S rRNA pseudouridine1911/1915/1917 synthase
MVRDVVASRAGRLDAVVAEALGVPRSDVQRAIAAGRVTVDGQPRPKSFRVRGGERIEADLRGATELAPDPGPLVVAYQDDDIAVVSKPAGMVTHPTASRREGTLVNRLLGVGIPLAPSDDPDRPGIVHRLDAGTSGLLVVAKTARARDALSAMFRRHAVDRTYLALVRGRPPNDAFLIEAPLGRDRARIRVRTATGKEAATDVVVRQRFGRASLVEARPRTGRTHQIRVHLSAAGHPILGDRAYGGGGDDAARLGLQRPFLHSWRLVLEEPFTGSRIDVEDPLPEDLEAALRIVRDST